MAREYVPKEAMGKTLANSSDFKRLVIAAITIKETYFFLSFIYKLLTAFKGNFKDYSQALLPEGSRHGFFSLLLYICVKSTASQKEELYVCFLLLILNEYSWGLNLE